MNLEVLLEFYETYRSENRFNGQPQSLYEPMNYIMDLGGKRVRPLLVLASCNAAHGDIAKGMPIAHAMEVFHNFTLLHDDIMDNSLTRRGKPTVHTNWNLPTAILAGDNMQVAAYTLISESVNENTTAVLQLFNKTAREVCEGQQMDMDFALAEEVSELQYLEMIRLKTAVLLGCCTASGALIAGMNPKHVDLVYDFAVNMGLTFQMKDDYLDVFGKEDATGKKPGGDIAQGKKTWLYIKANTMHPQLPTLYTIANNEEKISTITKLFRDLNLDVEMLKIMQEYEIKATQDLEKLTELGYNTGLLADILSWLGKRSG